MPSGRWPRPVSKGSSRSRIRTSIRCGLRPRRPGSCDGQVRCQGKGAIVMRAAATTTLEERAIAIQEAEAKEVAARRKALTGLVIAFALLLAIHFAPTFPGLRPTSQSGLAVFAWFIAMMVTDALPKAIVGFAAPLLAVVLAGVRPAAAFRAFSTDIFFLGAGAFVIAGIMLGTPLGRRIALKIVTWMRSNRVTRIQAGLGLADVAVGGVLPTVSETALFLPVTKAITTLMRGKE